MANDKLQPVRGTQDIQGELARSFRYIEKVAWECAQSFGFEEIQTPIFEFAGVFQKTLGEASDIVTKEMYSFEDKGGDLITLRPEGTAGIARAFISHQMSRNLPLKFYYKGPMFRYERPQKGRYRQFHQIGIELLGVESVQGDVEVIALANMILQRLGLRQDCVLELNSIGDAESRKNYREQLVTYLNKNFEGLSEDSKKRVEKNPLRVLDSKDQNDRLILENAPRLPDSLSTDAKARYEKVKASLDAMEISYKENPFLVRGLDYYDHTVFEFTTDKLGTQGAVISGGRYDGLIPMMGGPETPGFGWGAGLERLALMLGEAPAEDSGRSVAVIAVEESAEVEALAWAQKLRLAGFKAEQPYSGNLSKRLKKASKSGARWALLIGGDELKSGNLVVKDFTSGEQDTCKMAELISYLEAKTSHQQ